MPSFIRSFVLPPRLPSSFPFSFVFPLSFFLFLFFISFRSRTERRTLTPTPTPPAPHPHLALCDRDPLHSCPALQRTGAHSIHVDYFSIVLKSDGFRNVRHCWKGKAFISAHSRLFCSCYMFSSIAQPRPCVKVFEDR